MNKVTARRSATAATCLACAEAFDGPDAALAADRHTDKTGHPHEYYMTEVITVSKVTLQAVSVDA